MKGSLGEQFYDREKLKEMAQKNFILVDLEKQPSGVKLYRDDVHFPFTSFTDKEKFINEFLRIYCKDAKCPDQRVVDALTEFTKQLLYDPKPYNNNQSEMGHCASKIVSILDNFYRFKLSDYNLICNRNVEVNKCIRFPDQKSEKSRAGGQKPDFFLQQQPTKDIPLAPLWYLHEEKIEEKNLKDDFVKLCNLARAALDW